MRIGDVLTDEPGPEVIEVRDSDPHTLSGDVWYRDGDVWRLRENVGTRKWCLLVADYGPIMVHKLATDPTETPGGVWVALYWDTSNVVIFNNELDCLRHAVTNQMAAVYCPYGSNPFQIEPKDHKQ